MRRDHPLVLLCYFGAVLVLSMLTMHPLWIGTAFVSGCVVSGALSGWHALVKRLPGLVLFALGVALLNPLISHNGVTPLLFFRGNPITLEALCYGAVLGGLLSSLLLWGSIFSHLVDGEKILWCSPRPHCCFRWHCGICLPCSAGTSNCTVCTHAWGFTGRIPFCIV